MGSTFVVFTAISTTIFLDKDENLAARLMCLLSVLNLSPILSLKAYGKIVHNSCIQYVSLAFRSGLDARSIVFLSVRPVTSRFPIILTV